jgi:hypothetical protein
MTLDAACHRSKVDSTHDFPATLEQHGRSFRHIRPWLTLEEFTCEGARPFRRRVTGQASRRRNDSRLDKSPSVWTLARDDVATVDWTKVASSVFSLGFRVRLAYAFSRETLTFSRVQVTVYYKNKIPEDEGSIFLQNVEINLQDYLVSQSGRRRKCECLWQRKLQNLH